MISALNKLDDGTIELTITVPWTRVKADYQKTLAELAKKTEIKGFRKGKAPIKLVEQNTDKKAVYEEVLKILLPQVYTEAVKKHEIKPIINPQIKVINLQEGKDWQIQASTCELPKIKLGNYQEAVREALATEKIWTPQKAKKSPADASQEDKTTKVFKALLEFVKFKLPQILIGQEVNRMLSRLVDQTSQLGLTIEEYLASAKKTGEQLREEYRKQAQQTLKLEFILAQIAEKEKVIVSNQEVEEMIAAVPTENKKNLQSAEQKFYIQQLLRKRKVIDNLINL